jgi:hypothetical protein
MLVGIVVVCLLLLLVIWFYPRPPGRERDMTKSYNSQRRGWERE